MIKKINSTLELSFYIDKIIFIQKAYKFYQDPNVQLTLLSFKSSLRAVLHCIYPFFFLLHFTHAFWYCGIIFLHTVKECLIGIIKSWMPNSWAGFVGTEDAKRKGRVVRKQEGIMTCRRWDHKPWALWQHMISRMS